MRRSRKYLYVIIFFLAVCIKWTIIYYYEVVSSDKLLQVAAALSIVEGNGYAYLSVPLSDPGSTIMRPVVEWPPLYSVLLVPVLELTGSNIELSCFILDALAGFLVLLFFFLLMRKMQIPLGVQVLLLLHKAFELNYDTVASYSSDAMATAMWLATFHFLLQYLEKNKTSDLLLLSIANTCTFLLRYAYVPIAFVIPSLLIWNGIRKKNKFELKGGIVSLLVTLAGLGLLVIRNYFSAGTAVFNHDASIGFYPGSFSYCVPVFWLPFLNIDFYTMQGSLSSGISYGKLYFFLQLTSGLILLVLFFKYLRQMIKWRLMVPAGNEARFVYYGGTVSVSIVAMLFILSIITSINLPHLKEANWSYLHEVRYFQVPGIFILLVVSAWVFSRNEPDFFRKLMRVGLIAAFIIQIVHGCWILIKYHHVERRVYSRPVNSQENIANYLREAWNQERTKGNDVILLTDKYGFLGEAVINDFKVSNPVAQLYQDNISLQNRTLLLLVIDQQSVKHYQPIIDKHQFRFDQNIGPNAVFKKYY